MARVLHLKQIRRRLDVLKRGGHFREWILVFLDKHVRVYTGSDKLSNLLSDQCLIDKLNGQVGKTVAIKEFEFDALSANIWVGINYERTLFRHTPDKYFLYELSRDVSCLLENRNESIQREQHAVSKLNDLITDSINAVVDKSVEEDQVFSRDPYQVTLQWLAEYVGCKLGTIWAYRPSMRGSDDDAPYLTLEGAIPNRPEEYQCHCLIQNTGIVWKALEDKRSMVTVIEKISKSDLVNKHPEYIGKQAILVRIESNNEIVGVACLAGDIPSEKLKELSAPESKKVIEAIQKLSLMEIEQAKTKKQNAILKAVSNILPITVSQATEEAVCREICKFVAEIFMTQAASIFLFYNDDHEKLNLVASHVSKGGSKSSALVDFEKGKAPIYYQKGQSSLTNKVIMESKGLHCNSVSICKHNSHHYREIEDLDNDSWMGVPIVGPHNKNFGVLRCTGALRRIAGKKYNWMFDDDDVIALEHLALLVGSMLRMVRSVKAHDRINNNLKAIARTRAHDLKTPLCTINMNASFIKKYISGDEFGSSSRKLDDIIKDVDLCSFLLTDIEPTRETVLKNVNEMPLRPMLLEVRNFIRQKARRKTGIRSSFREDTFPITPFMQVDVTGSCPKVVVNRLFAMRALYNLADNALKYGTKGGNIYLAMDYDENEGVWWIDVISDGIGISEEDSEIIFDENQRGRNVGKRPGEGLGLTMAAKIAQAYGGRVEMISLKNPTVFRFKIPFLSTDLIVDELEAGVLLVQM